MWQSRRWRLLLNLIDHLPADSFYNEARLDDDEFADMVLAATDDDEDDPPPKMRLSDYSTEVALLTTIADRLAGVAAAVVAAAGVKPNLPKPLPRPETAIDRRRSEQRVLQHRSLVAALLPSRAPEGGATS